MARLQREFAAGQLLQERATEDVTISAGIAFYPEHANDLHSLQKQADVALYRSKYNGRARVTVYAPGDRADASLDRGGVGLEYLMADNRLLTTHRLVSLVDAVSAAAAMEQGPLSPTAFSEVLDRWSSSNSLHSQSVAALTVALAQQLGVEGEELEHVHLAALLHDAGKIAIPDGILSKPGPLTDDERSLVERHPMIGYELLRDLGVELAASFVLHHHERWDGAGYPDRLAGAEIPFGSRLILVADAFDALTSDRAYRRAVSVDAAIHEIQSESGRQFDPLIVSALHEHFAHPELSSDRHGSRAGLDMVFIDVGLVGLALGALLGGRIGALADVSIRGTYLAFAAILLQLIAFPSDVLPWSTPSSVARILWLISYALLIWMLQLNIRLRGTPFVAAGLACNLIAIVANHGLMPVRRAALIAAGRGYHVHNNSIQLGRPHLGALIDRWAVPSWIPFANVYSIGDVLIAVGLVVVIVTAMGGSLRRGRTIASLEPG